MGRKTPVTRPSRLKTPHLQAQRAREGTKVAETGALDSGTVGPRTGDVSTPSRDTRAAADAREFGSTISLLRL